MTSNKAALILKSKTDMTKAQIDELSETEAWSIIYSIRKEKIRDNRLQVCFTGFGVSKKEELTDLALNNKFKVVASVTGNLDLLCSGENAGPKKLEKAIQQGVQILTEETFRILIRTGEIPA